MHIEFSNAGQPIKLIQVTDPHLGEEEGSTLLGLDTDSSLSHVLALIAAERADVDLLLATGDLSNDGSLPSYQRFHRLTQSIARHSRWLPGNHDALAAMTEAVAGGDELVKVTDIGNWRIIMLNSAVPNQVGGCLSVDELALLRLSLAESTGQYALVCLHHHPIAIGSDWLDKQQVVNGADFLATLEEFSHVRGVLWGHIHQQVDQWRNDVRLMATPSSCVQFAVNSPDFKLGRQGPGYRWLELHDDGRIGSDISRVNNINFKLDYESSEGY